MGSNNNAKFLSLFNFLDKLEKYSEKAILQKGIVTKQQLSNLKAHLYKQVLISLRLNPIHQNIRIQIREQMDFAVILYQKGLYKLSLKILDKAKALALKNEEKYAAYDIVEFEKLIESKVKNWELERIAKMDLLLIKMALTEVLYFTEMPIKVSFNEYIEISKYYSTQNSKVFINGILVLL